MKPGILNRFKPRKCLPPLTPEGALYEWYSRGIDSDARLSGKAVLLLGWLAVLAAGEDMAPLPYTLKEINRKFDWPEAQMREAAEQAAAAGYVHLAGDTMILTDPRERPKILCANRENGPPTASQDGG